MEFITINICGRSSSYVRDHFGEAQVLRAALEVLTVLKEISHKNGDQRGIESLFHRSM